MSWQLVKQVFREGPPEDYQVKMLLLAVAEELREQGGCCDIEVEELRRRTSLPRSTFFKVQKRAIDQGWLLMESTRGPGSVNRYWLDDRKIFGTTPERVSERDSLPPERVSERDSFTPERVSLGDKRVSERDSTLIPYRVPSSSAAPEGNSPAAKFSDDDAAEAFNGTGVEHPRRPLRALVAVACAERGHTRATVNAYLREHMQGAVTNPHGLATELLREIPAYVAPASEPERLGWCGECDSDDHRMVEVSPGVWGHCPRCSSKAAGRDYHQTSAMVAFDGGGLTNAEEAAAEFAEEIAPRRQTYQSMGDANALFAQLARRSAMP